MESFLCFTNIGEGVITENTLYAWVRCFLVKERRILQIRQEKCFLRSIELYMS